MCWMSSLLPDCLIGFNGPMDACGYLSSLFGTDRLFRRSQCYLKWKSVEQRRRNSWTGRSLTSGLIERPQPLLLAELSVDRSFDVGIAIGLDDLVVDHNPGRVPDPDSLALFEVCLDSLAGATRRYGFVEFPEVNSQ